MKPSLPMKPGLPRKPSLIATLTQSPEETIADAVAAFGLMALLFAALSVPAIT